jgi:hypothetical protein
LDLGGTSSCTWLLPFLKLLAHHPDQSGWRMG